MQVTQDLGGPPHAPRLIADAIDGVWMEHFPSVPYSHGVLTEVINPYWDDIFLEPVEHAYFIHNGEDQSRDEWYVHKVGTDRYVVVLGEVDVALFDGREHSASFGQLSIVRLRGLGSESPSGLRIPPGVWHSFATLNSNLVLMNMKTPAYNREAPDKSRLPMPNELCGFTWDDQPAEDNSQ